MKLLLSDCHEGQMVTIARINGAGATRMRLVEMGLNRGVDIRVVKYAPLKDPLEIEVKGTHVSLRVKEAELVSVTAK